MLSPQQQIALDCLLAGETAMAASKKAGVSHQIVSRWKKLKEFRSALDAQATSVLDDIAAQLGPLVPTAIKAIKECLATANATVKIRAAALVLEQARAVKQEKDMEDKIAALEEELRAVLAGQAGQDHEADGSGAVPLGGPPTHGCEPVGRPDEPDEGSRLTA